MICINKFLDRDIFEKISSDNRILKKEKTKKARGNYS